MNWIPTKDQLPKAGAPVLMGVVGDLWIGYGYLDSELRGWLTQGGYVPLGSITHWMPQPPPPTA